MLFETEGKWRLENIFEIDHVVYLKALENVYNMQQQHK